jgi:hypothetical protein
MQFRKLVAGACVGLLGLIHSAGAATGTIRYQIGGATAVDITACGTSRQSRFSQREGPGRSPGPWCYWSLELKAINACRGRARR